MSQHANTKTMLALATATVTTNILAGLVLGNQLDREQFAFQLTHWYTLTALVQQVLAYRALPTTSSESTKLLGDNATHPKNNIRTFANDTGILVCGLYFALVFAPKTLQDDNTLKTILNWSSALLSHAILPIASVVANLSNHTYRQEHASLIPGTPKDKTISDTTCTEFFNTKLIIATLAFIGCYAASTAVYSEFVAADQSQQLYSDLIDWDHHATMSTLLTVGCTVAFGVINTLVTPGLTKIAEKISPTPGSGVV